ncbi:hypothetical protein [Streptomyces sp. SM12]|nr:hypothetical protein [Streptomyces sp. SM12]
MPLMLAQLLVVLVNLVAPIPHAHAHERAEALWGTAAYVSGSAP